MDLYIGRQATSQATAHAETELWKVWDAIMRVFQEDSTSYLEAKTWLIAAISELHNLPPRVRLEAFAPYLKFTAASSAAAAARVAPHHSHRHSIRHDRERVVVDGSGYGHRRDRSSDSDSEGGERSRRIEGSRRQRERDRSRSSDSDGEGRRRGRKDSRRQRDRSSDSSRSRDRDRHRHRHRHSRSSDSSRSRSRDRHKGRQTHRDRREQLDPHRFSASPSPPSSSPQPPITSEPATSNAPENPITQQLLKLLLEQQCLEVASLLARRPEVFRDFFAGSDLRIMMWFSHFSMSGMTGFKYGAFALAHYALAHREEAWQYLVWEGKHSQAPVAVATKTHYFCEINVLATVRNFIRFCPGFWSSEQLLKSFTQGGEVLQLEPQHFVNALHGILCEGSSTRAGRDSLPSRALDLLEAFMCQESWKLLSHHLLCLMDDEELLQFVRVISKAITLQPVRGVGPPKSATAGAASLQADLETLAGPGGWQDLTHLTLSGGAQWVSLPHLVLTHALANHRSQLHDMLQADEDLHAKLEEVSSIALRVHGFTADTGGGPDLYHPQSKEHRQLLASLRPPTHSASSRQLLALEAWTLRLALCPASRVPATATASSKEKGAASDGQPSLLEATVRSLGGTCRTVHSAAAAAGPSEGMPSKQHASVTGMGELRVYDMLPSSGEEEEGSEEEGKKGRKRKHKKASKGKHKKHRKGKKSKRRRSSPSDSGSSADEGTRSRRAGRDDRSGSPDSSIRGSEELGNGAKADHNKGTSEHLLFEVRLPTVASQGQREGHPLTVTGGAEIVADLLGCVALKCWLQSALLMHQ